MTGAGCVRTCVLRLRPRLRLQDYRDHRDKIFSKFVSMIEELIEARSGSLKLTDWDAPGSSGGDDGGAGNGVGGGGLGTPNEPCQFTADLRKGVTAMHNVLQQQLPADQLQVRAAYALSKVVVFFLSPLYSLESPWMDALDRYSGGGMFDFFL